MSNGSNKETIANRVSRGNGIIADIRQILDNVSLGNNYFEIAFLLRESLFLNSILSSCESWYGLTKGEITILSRLDYSLLRYIFKTPKTVPIVALYLESGCISIEANIKIKRIKILHHLANLNTESMLYKFFLTQWNFPSQKDMTEQMRLDLFDFKIPINLDYFKSISKDSFKSVVKTKARVYEFQQLMKQKQSLSKMNNLVYYELKMQEYLELKEFNLTVAISVFAWRIRMTSFGNNYGKQVTICPFCSDRHTDSQENSFHCNFIKSVIDIEGNYQELFNQIYIPYNVSVTAHKISMFREEFRKLSL